MNLEKAAINLRQAIGESRNWGIGWILRGDDGVQDACRIFDKAIRAANPQAKPAQEPKL